MITDTTGSAWDTRYCGFPSRSELAQGGLEVAGCARHDHGAGLGAPLLFVPSDVGTSGRSSVHAERFGDEYSIVFLADGAAYVRGFDHESPMSSWCNDGELWPGLIDGIPERFLKYVYEPTFGCEGVSDMTACLWTGSDATGSWEHGSILPPGGPGDQSGAGGLFELVSRPEPRQYRTFARGYYEVEIDAAAVADIYASRPLDQELVSRINPERVLSEMLDELRQVDYAVSE